MTTTDWDTLQNWAKQKAQSADRAAHFLLAAIVRETFGDLQLRAIGWQASDRVRRPVSAPINIKANVPINSAPNAFAFSIDDSCSSCLDYNMGNLFCTSTFVEVIHDNLLSIDCMWRHSAEICYHFPMVHLRTVRFPIVTPIQAQRFPFSIPVVRNGSEISFTHPVTFLVGENGAGKSTLIEALGIAVQARTIGSNNVESDPTLHAVLPLGHALRLVWNRRIKQGFFLRAEDFFGFVKRIQQTRNDLQREMGEIKEELQEHSKLAQGLAVMPFVRELTDIQRRYGDGLDTLSHGESFLRLFQERFVPQGLYLLDEPETPLSPLRQLALLSQMKVMVAQDCQFIIATHSPILMAYPEATIYALEEGQINRVAYDDLEHVRLTRDFLNNPQQFLRHL
jgi:predicted ATPase